MDFVILLMNFKIRQNDRSCKLSVKEIIKRYDENFYRVRNINNVNK